MENKDFAQMSDRELGRAILQESGSWGLVSLLVTAVVVLIVYGQIAKRAGFSRWWSLGLIVPIVGSFLPLIFASIPWPVERQRSRGAKKRKRRSK